MVISPYPGAVGLLVFTIAACAWHFGHFHRTASVAFGFSAAMAVISVIPLRDGLAALVSDGTGVVALLLVSIVGAFVLGVSIHDRTLHHRIWTNAFAIVLGASVILLIGDANRIARKAAKSPGKTMSALGKSITQIQSGRAAKTVPHDQAVKTLVIFAVVIVVLIIIAKRHDSGSNRKARPLTARKSARPAAIPQGTPGARAVPGRSGRAVAPARGAAQGKAPVPLTSALPPRNGR